MQITFTALLDPNASGAPAQLQNLANASGAGPLGEILTSDTIAPGNSVSGPTPLTLPAVGAPEIEITKSVSPISSSIQPGDDITYTFIIENTGNVAVENVVPIDTGPTFNSVSGATRAGSNTLSPFSIVTAAGFVDTDANSDLTVDSLAPGQSAQFTATYEVSEIDLAYMRNAADPATAIENSATATGDPVSGVLPAVVPSTVSTPTLVNPIDAMDDDFTSAPFSSTGGVTPSVFGDDTLNTVAVDPADLTTTLTDDGGLTGAVLNSDGTVTIPPGTPAGPYTLTYEICETLNPTNCDTAMVMIVVEADPIDAVDDDFTALPIAGGGVTPSLFGDDTMDGQSFNPGDVALTIIGDGGLTGLSVNPDGTLNIPVGTPAGTFEIEYQICDVINPTNCDIAVARIVIANPVNLFATKTATTATATTGSVVVYTITVRNDDTVAATSIEIVDTPPLGFRFVEGSGRLNGASVEPVLRNRELVWSGVDIAPGEMATVNLGLIVGAGVSVGDFVNTAFAETGPGTVLLSNEAQAIVRISPDEIFDCSELIGKVYEDLDDDGYQDEGERGLPGVRIATVNGLLTTTDEYGRYHIACAATPKQGIGSNFIVKLDERSLPTGFSVTSENPRVIRLTEGKLSSADFGVRGLRPMSIDLQPHAFIAGSNDLSPELSSAIAGVLEELRKEPTILTLNYEGEDGRARLDALVNRIRSDWGDGSYSLEIWTNSISGPVSGER